MEYVELTLLRSLKILWSFGWRAWLMLMPFMIACMGVMHVVAPFPKPGEVPKPVDPKFVPVFAVAYFLLLGLMILTYALALKFALKVQWSDFRIQLVRDKAQPSDNK